MTSSVLRRLIHSITRFQQPVRCFSINAKNMDSNCTGLHRSLADELIRNTHFTRRNYDRIIHIGCGNGEVTNMILNLFPKAEYVYTLDISPQLIEEARNKNPRKNIEFNVEKETGIKAGKFDLLTSFCPGDKLKNQSKLLQSINNILTPGGEFLIGVAVESLPSMMAKALLIVSKQDPWNDLPELAARLEPFTNDSIGAHRRTNGGEEDQDFRSAYRDFCSEAGLQVINADLIETDYVFESDEEFKNVLRALPPVKAVPDDKVHEFLDQCLQVYVDQGGRTNAGRLTHRTKMLHVHGMRPLAKYFMQDL